MMMIFFFSNSAFFAVLAPTFYMFIDNFEVSLLLGFLFGGGVAWTNSGYVFLSLLINKTINRDLNNFQQF